MHTQNQYSDLELVEFLKEGNSWAFDIIYQKYIMSMLDVGYKRLEDKNLCEDLVQNVFLRLWNKRADLEINNLEAYLRISIRYEVINYITRSKVWYAFDEPFELMTSALETADEKILSKEIEALIYAYADMLPEKRRQVFLLYIKSQYTTKEIAIKMGISQKTVQKHLNSALKDFRIQIKKLLFLYL